MVSEASFLSQLEQRTQQVKITLANLEAEKIRIEELIGRLQPLVPHYDALLAAESVWLRAFDSPVGSSLLCVARKPDGAEGPR